MVSDIVLAAPLPAPLRDSALLYNSCVAGALVKEEYLGSIAGAGFMEIAVQGETVFPLEHIVSEPELAEVIEGIDADERASLKASIVSVKVAARRPAGCTCGCGGTR